MEARLTGIDRRVTLQYLQFRGGVVPEKISTDLDRCEQRLLAAARPRALWKLFDRLPDGRLAGTVFRPLGGDVERLLKSSTQVILMAVTLGSEVEVLLRRAQVSDMADAVILDAAGSAAVENVCDNLCADLAELLAPRYLTDRFSPGYGDLPLSQQAALCEALDVTRRLGVSLSESGLLIPQKTVTALIGVSAQPQPKRRGGCNACALAESCQYRKDGKDCGKA